MQAAGIPTTSHQVYTWVDVSIYKKLSKHILHEGFEAVHSHLIYADFWTSIIKRFYHKDIQSISCKHGYHEHTYTQHCLKPSQAPHNLYSLIYNFAEKKIDYAYACSHGLKHFHQGLGLYNSSNMQVIQHGFQYPEVEQSEAIKRTKKENQLLLAGRLIPRKGHALLLEAVCILKKRGFNIHVWIIGTGPMQQEIEKKIDTLQLTEHVELLGYKTDVMSYMAAADLVVVPSYCEGLPLVILEAFNSGTACVAFDTYGCNEAIEQEVTGWLARPFDVVDFANHIADAVQNPHKSKKISTAASERLRQYFTLNRMALETAAVYEGLLKR